MVDPPGLWSRKDEGGEGFFSIPSFSGEGGIQKSPPQVLPLSLFPPLYPQPLFHTPLTAVYLCSGGYVKYSSVLSDDIDIDIDS